MPTLTTQMTKALDTWTPTGCQGELLRADEVNLYYQNARLGRVDYMTVHEGISDKTIEHSCKLAAYSEQDLQDYEKRFLLGKDEIIARNSQSNGNSGEALVTMWTGVLGLNLVIETIAHLM